MDKIYTMYSPLLAKKINDSICLYKYSFYRNTGFKPLDANDQIQNFVSDMYVIQDVLLLELFS